MPSQAQSKRKTGTPNNDERPVGKRSRVSRACDQCRTAREKCDGVKPICLTCSTSNRTCSYTTNPKKRGIQPGYIRTLELALTWLFNNVPDTEGVLNRKLAREDIDKLLSGEDIGGPDPGRIDSEDQDSDVDELEPASSVIPEYIDIDSIVVPQDPIERPSDENTSATNIRLPANRWRLVDIYFAYTHCWLPVCEKHDILKTIYSYPDQGLPLSSNMSDSAGHAELWSILALASVQEQSIGHSAQETSSMPQRLYDIARSLIPLEPNTFELSHVKALLVLAVINMSQSAPEAAWLLIGHASRILLILEQKQSVPRSHPKFSHVFAGCVLLDSILSMHLRQRSYLQHADLERFGKINEDGLEEWQPWTGCLDSETTSGYESARDPVRSLSIFNLMVEIIGILSINELTEHRTVVSHENMGRIERWKATLPPHFQYIQSEGAPVPSNPPSFLLLLVYTCSAIILFSSQIWVQRLLALLERFRETLGFFSLPPILLSLIGIVEQSRAFESADRRVQSHLQKLKEDYAQAWACGQQHPGNNYESNTHIRPLFDTTQITSARPRTTYGFSGVQIPTPESIPPSLNHRHLLSAKTNTNNADKPRVNDTLLDELLPDMSTASSHHPTNIIDFQSIAQPSPHLNAPQYYSDSALNRKIQDHPNSGRPRDLQSFFDELASLDSAEKMESQPQFMQNLGFAPDTNIADLFTNDFSQFNPLVSPYMPRDEQAQIGHKHLFDGC
ncbi:hypothetical protein CC78DRAFT_544734 [Lojkania enalia]|uniref:Zn(2)-C6 fungal-type domain-containing protein n=1 Tax=Lojkania enalia TaxID=147567 RepID=A0A9P4K813_9PLEO|nr:hypothetical protein CC78DRAFT_544734 [Didymosphaeria enalia]